MRIPALLRLLASLALCGLGGCSLLLADFDECAETAQCGQGRVCVDRYCVVDPVPQGCGERYGNLTAENPIPLGAALPLTWAGVADESEVQGLNAYRLALEEINQRDGVGGRQFVLHVCDTQRDDERIKLQAQWLADELGAKAVFTSGSGQTIKAATELVPREVVVMSATSTSPEITNLLDRPGGGSEGPGLVWRTAPSDEIQGRVIARLLSTDPRFFEVNRLGILYLGDPYGQGLNSVLQRELAGAGMVLKSVQYDRGGEISSAVTQLDAFDPDLTVLVGFPEDAARIVDAGASRPFLARSAGHRWFFTDSAKDPALLKNLANPAEIEGALGTAPAQGAGGSFSSFKATFESKYDVDPAQFSFTSHSYDAFYVVALGAAWAVGTGEGEVSGPRIADGMTRLSSGKVFRIQPVDFTDAKVELQQGRSIDLSGASGTLNFDPKTGEAPSPIELWQVSQGGFVTLELRDAPPG